MDFGEGAWEVDVQMGYGLVMVRFLGAEWREQQEIDFLIPRYIFLSVIRGLEYFLNRNDTSRYCIRLQKYALPRKNRYACKEFCRP